MRRIMMRRRQPGSAVAEFTVSFALLILVLVAIIQGGMLMVTLITASNAAREVARAAVTVPPGDVQAIAAQASMSFERDVQLQRSGGSVKATVRLKTPLVFQAFPEWGLWVSGSTTMRQER